MTACGFSEYSLKPFGGQAPKTVLAHAFSPLLLPANFTSFPFLIQSQSLVLDRRGKGGGEPVFGKRRKRGWEMGEGAGYLLPGQVVVCCGEPALGGAPASHEFSV